MPVRDTSIDIAKGIAIVAIVFGHVWRGLYAADLIAGQHLYQVIDTAIYMWHLSVFAFTSGLFVSRAMERSGPWFYALRRDAAFLWLYLLWSIIQGIIKVIAGSAVNSPTRPSDLLRIWEPDGQLWFLGWIALMMAIAAIAHPWVDKLRAILVAIGSLLLSAFAWGLNGSIIGTQGLGLTIYFVFGLVWTGAHFTQTLRRIPPVACLGLAVTLGSVMVLLSVSSLAVPPTTGGDSRSILGVLLGMVASTCGLFSVLFISRLLSLTKLSSPIAYVGERSMAIFLAHIVFASGTRIALAAVGLEEVWVQASIGTLVGVIGPLAILGMARQLRIAWLFDIPRQLDAKLFGRYVAAQRGRSPEH